MQFTGVVTPAGHFSGLMDKMLRVSLSGQPPVIAGVLHEIADRCNVLNRPDLGGRLAQVSTALERGDYSRSSWINSPLYGEMLQIHSALQQGEPIEEAMHLRQKASKLQAVIQEHQKARQPVASTDERISIGPAPLIEWKKFGSAKFPAPNPPSTGIASAGKRLSYFVFFVAGIAGHGDMELETEDFYGISGDMRRKIRRGYFVPKDLGKFPTEDARRLIGRAAQLEPKYGQLMQELIIQALFEAQGWSLGLPDNDAPWYVSFLYRLRRHVAFQLLTEGGTRNVLRDRALIRVVRNRVSLEKVSWHPGRTRREVFDPWLEAINAANPKRLEAQRRHIGNGILKITRWSSPPKSATEAERLQWLVRYWTAHYHYGALPGRGLPYKTDDIVRFLFAVRPVVRQNIFTEKMKAMISDFYAPEELETLRVLRSRE